MDAGGNIYDLEVDRLNSTETEAELVERHREDVARLEGFLRGRAESDRPDHEAELARVRDERLRRERRVAR